MVGRHSVAKSFLVPKEVARSGSRAFEKANFLWDHYGYVLGHPKSAASGDVQMASKQHESFKTKVESAVVAVPNDVGLNALESFLGSDVEKACVFADQAWEACARVPGCNLAFRLATEIELIGQNATLRQFISDSAENEVAEEAEDEDKSQDAIGFPHSDGFCAVTGGVDRIERLHPRTPIRESKSNAKLVSFQKNCGFDSYGKEQGFNASIGKRAAFAYTTALNHLLRKGSPQRRCRHSGWS